MCEYKTFDFFAILLFISALIPAHVHIRSCMLPLTPAHSCTPIHMLMCAYQQEDDESQKFDQFVTIALPSSEQIFFRLKIAFGMTPSHKLT